MLHAAFDQLEAHEREIGDDDTREDRRGAQSRDMPGLRDRHPRDQAPAGLDAVYRVLAVPGVHVQYRPSRDPVGLGGPHQ
jgi:hypothetical protein